MKINFFAGLRQVAGQKTIDIPLTDGATVAHLIETIARTYPALGKELLDDQQILHQHVHVVVNGRAIQFLEGGMDRLVSPTDTISIFPAIGSGCRYTCK